MDDLRQGVTPAGHLVLDFLDERRAEWAHLHDLPQLLLEADAAVDIAIGSMEDRRDAAILAAALLIEAIHRIDPSGGATS